MTAPAASPVDPSPLRDPELLALLASGVSIGVATGDAALRPHSVRVVGVRQAGDTLRLLVPSGQARPVLEDVAANGRVAVVVTRPSTHRTVQLKGRDARAVEPDDEDLRCADAYRQAFAAELARVGFPDPYAEVLLDDGGEPRVAIVFTPVQAFQATPGPNAGEPLEGPR